MIKPVVNISKIIDAYDVIVCGLNGVIHDGCDFKPEAISALLNMRKSGKQVILLSNTSMRLRELCNLLYANGISPRLFNNIITAGEVLHARLQACDVQYAALGKVYYNLGVSDDEKIFDDLDYHSIENSSRADFLFAGRITGNSPDDYMEVLAHCASLNIPMLCVGNDRVCRVKDENTIAAGLLAEQYTIFGGQIITIGKPDRVILEYALEAYHDINKDKILLIGDSVPVDIKAANTFGIESLLVTFGIHSQFLGDGYIPDVTKTRELAISTEAFPDYIISNLRW